MFTEWSYDTAAAPTLQQYHNAVGRGGKIPKIRGVAGPPGSGKSAAMAVEHCVFLPMRQEPDNDGVRRTKLTVIRSTYDRLKKTTFKTINDWIIPGSGSISRSPPMEGLLTWAHPSGDGTTIELIVEFMSIDTIADLDKLDSLETSHIYLNEGNELIRHVYPKALERISRYPSHKNGPGCTEPTISIDFNMQATTHWLHELFVEKSFPENEYFAKEDVFYVEQPPAVFCDNYDEVLEKGRENVEPILRFNKEAENLANLKEGYYGGPLATYTWAQIQARLMMKWVSQDTGKLIHEQYRADYHRFKGHIAVVRDAPIYIGFDTSGHNKAFVACQHIGGQLRVIREAFLKGGTEPAIKDVLIPMVQQYFAGMAVLVVVDCADPKDERTYTTPTRLVQENGFAVVPAPGNNRMENRINAMDHFFLRTGAFLISAEGCPMAAEGLDSKYCFKKDTAATKALGTDVYTRKKDDNDWAHFVDATQNVALFIASKVKSVNKSVAKPTVSGRVGRVRHV